MNLPSLPLGLSQRDLEPRDPEAQWRREVEAADNSEEEQLYDNNTTLPPAPLADV